MLIADIFSLFRQGRELSNAATWKNRTIAINALVGVFSAVVAIAKALGFDLGLDQRTLEDAAAGVFALLCIANAVMHAVTSARAGLPSKPGPQPAEPGQPGPGG